MGESVTHAGGKAATYIDLTVMFLSLSFRVAGINTAFLGVIVRCTELDDELHLLLLPKEWKLFLKRTQIDHTARKLI